jgi:hypothetical protein
VIYFMQSVDGGSIKIGFSDDVDRRRGQLESHYGTALAILATMPGNRDEEARIHARFSHLRLGRTEQFRPAPELLGFIGRPLLVGANPDAVEAMPCRIPVTNVRSRPEWKSWLERFAEHAGADVSEIIDQALLQYARVKNFDMPPSR